MKSFCAPRLQPFFNAATLPSFAASLYISNRTVILSLFNRTSRFSSSSSFHNSAKKKKKTFRNQKYYRRSSIGSVTFRAYLSFRPWAYRHRILLVVNFYRYVCTLHPCYCVSERKWSMKCRWRHLDRSPIDAYLDTFSNFFRHKTEPKIYQIFQPGRRVDAVHFFMAHRYDSLKGDRYARQIYSSEIEHQRR